MKKLLLVLIVGAPLMMQMGCIKADSHDVTNNTTNNYFYGSNNNPNGNPPPPNYSSMLQVAMRIDGNVVYDQNEYKVGDLTQVTLNWDELPAGLTQVEATITIEDPLSGKELSFTRQTVNGNAVSAALNTGPSILAYKPDCKVRIHWTLVPLEATNKIRTEGKVYVYH